MIRRAVCLLLACAGAAWGQNITRTYDVATLVERIADDCGEPVGLELPAPERTGNLDDPQWVSVEVRLATLVHETVNIGHWVGEQRIVHRDKTLVASTSPAVHAQIADLLAWLRATAQAPITLEVRVYQGPARSADAIVSGGSVLDPTRGAQLEQSPWKRVSAERLTLPLGQQLHLGSVQSQRYLAWYATNEGTGESPRPVWRALREGAIHAMRAVRSSDGRYVSVDLAHDSARVDGPSRAFASGLHGPSGTVLAQVELPQLAVRRLRGTFWMPAGGAAIAGLSRWGTEARVLVVQDVGPVAALPALREDGPWGGRVIDTRMLLHAPEVAPPWLSGARQVDDAEDAEVQRITSDELTERIKEDVVPESWEALASRLSVMDGRLVVAQTRANLSAVAEYVRRQEGARRSSVLVRAQIIEAAAEAAAQALTVLVGQTLSEAQRTALCERLSEARDLTVIADLSSVSLLSQRVHAAAIEERAVLLTTGSEPLGSVLRTGHRMVVRATPTDGDALALDLRLSSVRLLELDARDGAGGFRYQVPRLDERDRRIPLVLASGQSTLVDLTGGRFACIEVHRSRE